MRIRTKLYYTIPKDADDEDLIFKWKLYSCALEDAPDRKENKGVLVLLLAHTWKNTNTLYRCEERGRDHS